MFRNLLNIVGVALLLLLCQSPLQAQQVRMRAGDLEVGAQLGLVSIYRIDRAQSIVPPIGLQAEYFVSPRFSFGIFLNYVEAEADRLYAGATVLEHYHSKTWASGLRTTAYSKLLANRWRIFGGLAIGAILPQVTTTVRVQGEPTSDLAIVPSFSKTPTSSMLFSGFVGSQYYITPSLSLTAEVGYGLSLANVGLRYKL
ncbi:MAG: hypothetical protein D6772_16230 [Bacteroidetes bacterium]|nr:MAG: hypothetical protein D6772_16230 [Bacteroidota bacterium]